MSEIKRESPLIGREQAVNGAAGQGDSGVTLRERPFIGHIALRGKPDDEAFTAACEKVLGIALPTEPNSQVEGGGIVICWIRPTEWLVLTEGEVRQGWLDALREALNGIHSGVVDLSGGQTLIEVRGPHAFDTLSKGTPLDVHSRSFDTGQCTRTLMAHSTIMLRVVQPGQAFEIIIRRSFADHIWHWLTDCAREYGYSVEAPESALQWAGVA